jgi:hypothetical protein
MTRQLQFGDIYLSMAVPESALAVSRQFRAFQVNISYEGTNVRVGKPLEDFALTEAAYTIVRILQKFPVIKPGPFTKSQTQTWLGYSSHQTEAIEKVAKERQKMTLVMSLGDGCPVIFGR